MNNGDLISREAALKEICLDCHKPLPQYPEHGCPDPCYVYGGVSNLPATDVVEVVRCGNCAYYTKAEVNKKGFLICPASGMEITELEYRSFGERRSE